MRKESSLLDWLDGKVNRSPEIRRLSDEMLNEMRIEQELAALREAKGVSQVKLAKRLGVSQPYIAKFESGRVKNPGLRTVIRYATALGAKIQLKIADHDAPYRAVDAAPSVRRHALSRRTTTQKKTSAR
jgi:transcriptional regulator with XRE-family HTH domain